MVEKEINKCIKCNTEYEMFMFSNFNLGLCQECYNKAEEEGIERNDYCDEVTHVITCPLCNAKYNRGIIDENCSTASCPVKFFWDELDGQVIARWIKPEFLEVKK